MPAVFVRAPLDPDFRNVRAYVDAYTKPQLLSDAMLMPAARARSGKISDIMTKGSGPRLTAKAAM